MRQAECEGWRTRHSRDDRGQHDNGAGFMLTQSAKTEMRLPRQLPEPAKLFVAKMGHADVVGHGSTLRPRNPV